MSLGLSPALHYPIAELAALLQKGFDAYPVAVTFSPSLLSQVIKVDGADLHRSRVLLAAGEPVGCALIARRGWTSRLVAMGIDPDARGRGVGRGVLRLLLEEAREEGDRNMVLEVLEANEAGVRLYRGAGFRVIRRLVGYHADDPAGTTHETAEEIDLAALAREVVCHAAPDLPWQLSGESLAQLGPPARAFRLGSAYAAITDPELPLIYLRGLLVEPQGRLEGQATRLLRELFGLFPGRQWRIRAHVPEEMAPRLFAKVGMERDEITQLQMAAEL